MQKLKINFKQVAMGAFGTAAATFVAGFINKMGSKPNSKGEPTLNDEARGIVLIAAGAFVPQLLPKDELATGASYGLIGKGVDTLLKRYFPDAVKGIDGIDGVYDDYPARPDSLAGLDYDQPAIVAASDGDDTVTGTGNTDFTI